MERQLDLSIDTSSQQTISSSFDRIAKDLILNWQLKITNRLFSLTEIEFYYFYKGIHEDNATHIHGYDQGKWRFHSQGLDITFQGTDISDGGILIRGLRNENSQLKTEEKYINGPRRVLETIFRNLNSVTNVQQHFGLVPRKVSESIIIYKTIRHGLSKTQDNEFKDHIYRYYTELDNWRVKHVRLSDKAKIKSQSQTVEI